MKQAVQYTAKLNFVGFNDDELAEQVTSQLKASFANLPAEKSQFVVDVVKAKNLSDIDQPQQVETKPTGDLSQRAIALANLARTQILSFTRFEYLIINDDKKTVSGAHRDNISSDTSTSVNKLTVVIYKPTENDINSDYASLVTSLKLIPSGAELAKKLADFIGNHFIMEQIGSIYTKAYSDSKYTHMLPAPRASLSGLELARAEDNVRRLWSVLSEAQKEFASGIGLAPEGDKSYPIWGRDHSDTRHKELISEAIMQAEGKVKAINEPVMGVTQRSIR